MRERLILLLLVTLTVINVDILLKSGYNMINLIAAIFCGMLTIKNLVDLIRKE